MVKLQGFLRVAAVCFVGVCAKKLSTEEPSGHVPVNTLEVINDDNTSSNHDVNTPAYASEDDTKSEEQREEQPYEHQLPNEFTPTEYPYEKTVATPFGKDGVYETVVAPKSEKADYQSHRFLGPKGERYCERRTSLAGYQGRSWYQDSWCESTKFFLLGLYTEAHSDCERRDVFRGMLAGVKHVFEHHNLGEFDEEAKKVWEGESPCGQSRTPKMDHPTIYTSVSEEDNCGCSDSPSELKLDPCFGSDLKMRDFTEFSLYITHVPRGIFYVSKLYAKGGRRAVIALLNALVQYYEFPEHEITSEVDVTTELLEKWSLKFENSYVTKE